MRIIIRSASISGTRLSIVNVVPEAVLFAITDRVTGIATATTMIITTIRATITPVMDPPDICPEFAPNTLVLFPMTFAMIRRNVWWFKKVNDVAILNCKWQYF